LPIATYFYLCYHEYIPIKNFSKIVVDKQNKPVYNENIDQEHGQNAKKIFEKHLQSTKDCDTMKSIKQVVGNRQTVRRSKP